MTYKEIFKHVQKYRRLHKGLLDYEMVFRHLKSILFPVPINDASHKTIKSGSPTLQFHNKSSEFKKWSTILRSYVIILMLLSIPDIWMKPRQPSQHPAESKYSFIIHVAETCISWHDTQFEHTWSLGKAMLALAKSCRVFLYIIILLHSVLMSVHHCWKPSQYLCSLFLQTISTAVNQQS